MRTILYDLCTLQVVSPPLQRGHYPFFTFSDGRESSVVVPPPSSTFTLSIRRESDTMDSGNDDDFVVIECASNRSPVSTSDAVAMGSCEPDTTKSRDPPVESNYVVVDSQTISNEHSLNSAPD